MLQEKYTALLLGSNGLIGSLVLNLLLENDKYKQVYAVTRTHLTIKHPKLIQIIADSSSIQDQIESLHVDHLYSCIGTTNKKTPDPVRYTQIDHDYPIFVAELLKKNGCKAIAVISSIGANLNSSNFYLQLKGKVEKSTLALGYDKTIIFRPSLLIGKRKESRITEDLAKWLSPIINIFFIGKLRNYRSINAETVASAMVKSMLQEENGIHIYQSQEIKEKA